MRFNLLQLFVVVVSRLIAWMLAACEQLIGNDTARPDIDFLTVAFAYNLFWSHVERCTSTLFRPLTPILFCREAKVDNFDIDAIIAFVEK